MQKDRTNFFETFKKYIKILEAILFVCSVAYCFQSTILCQAIVGVVWILRAVIQWLVNVITQRRNPHAGDCAFALAIFLLPQVAVHIYTVILIVFGVTSANVLSTNVVTYTATLTAISAIYLFNKNAVNLVFWSLALSWVYCLLRSIVAHGFGIIPDAMMQGWLGISVGHENYLELDAVVLSVGYYLVWYLFSKRETKMKALPLAILLMVVFILGVKRIVIVAMLAVFVCYLIIPKKNEAVAYKIGIVAGWLAMAFCVAYIFVLSLGDVFYDVLDKLGIDTMARNYFYKHIMSLTEFSPTFLGYGRGSVKIEMFKEFAPYTHVHSDIIKMFFELGFVPFLLWLGFTLVGTPICFKKRYGKSAAIFYLLVTAYTVILFLTDNTENYFVSIVIRTVMPMGYVLVAGKNQENHISKL